MVCKNTEKNVQRICHIWGFTTCPTSRKSAITQHFISGEMNTDRPEETGPVGEERDACSCSHTSAPAAQGRQHLCTFPVELPLPPPFFKRRKQPVCSQLLLPPKPVANRNWPQGKQEHQQLLWWRSPTVFAVLKKKTFICQTDSKKQIPVLSLISPQSDMKHHVNPTKYRSETATGTSIPAPLPSNCSISWYPQCDSWLWAFDCLLDQKYPHLTNFFGFEIQYLY